MRLWPGALAVLLLLALLTWLLLRGTDTNAPAYAATLRAFDDFALERIVLEAGVVLQSLRLAPLFTDKGLARGDDVAHRLFDARQILFANGGRDVDGR